MTLSLIRLLIDFGFLILIWCVQLVIYPSFKFYTDNNLFAWHTQYTKRVTVIVLPLMLGQLLLGLIGIYLEQNWYTILSLFCIILLWILTFKVFVPLHFSIDNDEPIDNVCDKLVSKNWWRTLFWTLLFFFSLVNVLIN